MHMCEPLLERLHMELSQLWDVNTIYILSDVMIPLDMDLE